MKVEQRQLPRDTQPILSQPSLREPVHESVRAARCHGSPWVTGDSARTEGGIIVPVSGHCLGASSAGSAAGSVVSPTSQLRIFPRPRPQVCLAWSPESRKRTFWTQVPEE